jgi:hypothetical protein
MLYVSGFTFSKLSSVEAGDTRLLVSSDSTMSDSLKEDIADALVDGTPITDTAGEYVVVDEVVVGVGTAEPRSETLDVAAGGLGLTGERQK